MPKLTPESQARIDFIREMRRQGASRKAIAAATGLSLNQVNGYMNNYGLARDIGGLAKGFSDGASKQIAVRLPPKHMSRIRQISFERKISASAVICEFVAKSLDEGSS